MSIVKEARMNKDTVDFSDLPNGNGLKMILHYKDISNVNQDKTKTKQGETIKSIKYCLFRDSTRELGHENFHYNNVYVIFENGDIDLWAQVITIEGDLCNRCDITTDLFQDNMCDKCMELCNFTTSDYEYLYRLVPNNNDNEYLIYNCYGTLEGNVHNFIFGDNFEIDHMEPEPNVYNFQSIEEFKNSLEKLVVNEIDDENNETHSHDVLYGEFGNSRILICC